jgi:hypothetical protein
MVSARCSWIIREEKIRTWLDAGNDLYSGRTATNNSHPLPFQLNAVIPVGTVEHWALECLTAADIRPLPFAGVSILVWILSIRFDSLT